MAFSTAGASVPKGAAQNAEDKDRTAVDEFGAKDYRQLLQLKLDHKSRPLWVVSRMPKHPLHIHDIW